MNEATIGFLENSNQDDFLRILKEFNFQNIQTMTFDDLSVGELRKRFWRTLFHHLTELKQQTPARLIVLETMRILSRDKTGLDEIFNAEMAQTLVGLAGLSTVMLIKQEMNDDKVTVEAQKCLCNLIYNSLTVQRLCCSIGCLEGIAERLKTFKDADLPHQIKFFDMKMLFLLTALCPDVRPRLKSELHGMTYLIELLSLISSSHVKKGASHMGQKQCQTKCCENEVESRCYVMEDHYVDLACEVLKILFNLTVDVDRGNVDEDDEMQFSRLISILRELLLCSTSSDTKREELQSHTVNLLTNLPFENCENLVKPLLELSGNGEQGSAFDFEGHNVEAISSLFHFLEIKLEKPGKCLREAISPILSCLIECSRSNRIVRKFLRSKILPPLRDVYTRPEEGETSRNKLCRLLTHPVVEVKDLVAELLFVLCKENVGRLIKYSGYGNAAGLLAARGLVPAKDRRDRYSSESEDSETEEYRAVKDSINPVIGCYDEPKTDSLAGMTEEQKEYEVMQLVNMMNKMTETGIVTPMRMDDEGKLKAVEHVLELREGGFVPTLKQSSFDWTDEKEDKDE